MEEKVSFFIWSDFAAYVGISFSTKRHNHFYHQFCFTSEKSFLLKGKSGENFESNAALIPSGISHETTFGNKKFTILLVDPLVFEISNTILHALNSGFPAIDLSELFSSEDITLIENNLKSQQNDARENIIGLLRSKVGTDNAKTIDSRIEKILPSLRTEMDELSLSEVANFAQLSPSRFRHLFKEETGISFSSYKLWLKTQKAVRLLITNKDIINAAHAGGFFDQPHFSRILKRSFGLSPLEMKKNPHFELKIFS